MNLQKTPKERKVLETMDYKKMMEEIDRLATEFDCLSVRYIGESMMGRGIPLLSLGKGEKAVLYVGAQRGGEWMLARLLLRFVREYCGAYERGETVFGYNMKYFFSTRTIHILPMLNPDGVEYRLHGVGKDHVLYDRLLSMNGGSADFSAWQANGRGVDLRHNYNSGFLEYKSLEREAGILGGAPEGYSGEHPESEPEVGYLSNFIRFDPSIRSVVALSGEGEGIYYTSRGQTAKRSYAIAKALFKLSGYELKQPEGALAYGSLRDFCIEVLGLPAFTVALGKKENIPSGDDLFYHYTRLREMLFLMPTFV